MSGALYHSRNGLQAALNDLESGKANCLIIANLSRYSRDREHQSTIKKRVESAGARLVFCDMDFADTPEGDLAFGIMGTFADYERKVIKERTMKGRRRRAEQGIQPCRNHSPFGYHVPSSKDVLKGSYPPETLGKYIVIEEQAELVREMFQRVANGDSVRSVARWLTDSGVPTPRGAVVWNCGSLQRMLGHPIYKGLASFGRFQRKHDESCALRGYRTAYRLVERPQDEWVCMDAPALVDEETWNAVQQKITTNRANLSGRADRKHLLTGLMHCPKCKQKMRAGRRRHAPKNKESEFYNFYECRCARPSTNLQRKVCNNKKYRGSWAEPLVMRAISEIAHRAELTTAAVAAYKSVQARKQKQPNLGQLQRQLADVDKQEKATIKAQIAGVMAGADSSVYEEMLRELATKRNRISDALARSGHGVEKKSARDEATMVRQAIAAVDEVLNAPDNELTPAEKQGLLARVIDAIYPKGEEGLKITLKTPLNDQSVAYSTTYRYPASLCIFSKASLICSRPIFWVISSSTKISPCM